MPSKTALSGLAGTGNPEAAGCACQSGIAPGISYDYGKIGVTDVGVMTALRQTYPGGFFRPPSTSPSTARSRNSKAPPSCRPCLPAITVAWPDPHVYVSGDSGPHPYSKSANTSNTEGHYIVRCWQRAHRLLSQYGEVVPGC